MIANPAAPSPAGLGTVYGVLMNFRDEHAALGAAMAQAPYQEPPRSPVLYIKTANTHTASGGVVPWPRDTGSLLASATVGLVIGPGHEPIGWRLLCDFSLPHSFFRPPVRSRCADGLLGLGNGIKPWANWEETAAFELSVFRNGRATATVRFDQLIREPETLYKDVSAFMSLAAGDMLMLGASAQTVALQPGDQIEVQCAGFAALQHTMGQPA